ncbi:nucleoside diphosphate kinase III, chloroplastic/mitochondrial-like isoform X1 [Nymphaea colorata]|uniref:nucleoside diphosphate kinase III, chloroplastic/mitochondrial-like isoform X1 n=1 Tax=Nymphaea colorata TaxID=210225 RepID=UPI00129E826F|nr:nucleoside diphosphate kinase III, chloroplastic/mitochondrial-like isoform X1 [Nymphaea colorata]
MSSQICRAASRSARTLFAASRNSVLFSKGRAVAEASAASFRGRMSRLASVCQQKEARSTLRAWLSGALVLPAAVYMLQDQPAQAAGMERIFVLIKPDGMKGRRIAEIIAHFERQGFELVAIKLVLPKPTKDVCEKHYRQFSARGSYVDTLCKSLCSGPVLVMVWEGKSQTIVGDLAVLAKRNIIDRSTDSETAKSWIDLWFK